MAMRISLALLFAIISLLQIFSFPGQFEHMSDVEGLSRLYEVSLTLLFAAWFLCGQLAIFSIWKVIGFMERSELFSAAALPWVNRVVSICWIAVVVPAVIFMATIPRADDPGFFVLLTAIGLFLVSLALFATILREQIRSRAF